MPNKQELESQGYEEFKTPSQSGSLMWKLEENTALFYVFEGNSDDVYQRFPSEIDLNTLSLLLGSLGNGHLLSTRDALATALKKYQDFQAAVRAKKTDNGVAAVAKRYLEDITKDIPRIRSLL